MLKEDILKYVKFFVVLTAVIFIVNEYMLPQEAMGFDQKWDQGHDGTDPDDPPEDDDECKGSDCDDCDASGSPVIFIDGSYHTQFTDIKIPGTPEIKLKRYYRSKHSFRTGYFGYGWSIAYEVRLQQIEADQQYIAVLMPNGQVFRFLEKDDGTYETPVGTTMILSKNASEQFELAEINGGAYIFDEDGRLTAIIDKNANKIDIAYSDGCISAVSAEDGRGLTFTKGVNGKIAAIADHTGRTLQYSYDDNGNLTGFTNSEGNAEVFAYQDHQIISVSDFKGNIITSVSYDDNGKVISLTEKGLTYTYEYPGGNVVRRTDIDGTWEFTYNDAGLVISVKDPGGNTTAKEFDDNGNLALETNARGNTTTYTYDDLGNILTIKDPLGNVTTFTYYAGTTLVETETDPRGIVTKYEYDDHGNIIRIYHAFGSAEQTVAENIYDDSGNLLSITDPNGNAATFTYDEAGRLLSESKDGQTVTYEYDESGNLKKTTYPWGGAREITYDDQGRKLTDKDPEGNVVSYTYDENGKLKTYSDALGNVTTNEYDDYGRLTKVTDPAGNAREFTLDEKGRPVSVKNRNGVVQTLTYNYQGSATEITTGSFTQKFEYDANGNRTAHTDADGNTTASQYDELNRLFTKKSPLDTEAAYKYNKNGNLTSVDFAGPGIGIKKTYDMRGRELSVSDSLGTIGTTKTYDANGNILKETDAKGNAIVCEYDAFNRITKKTFMDGTWQTYRYNNKGVIDQITSSNGAVTTFVHDKNGRILSSTDTRGTYSVTYDTAAGNVATRTDPNGNTTTYEYDELNRVKKETYPDGSTKEYTYRGEGELKSVKDRNGNTIQYEYNDLGLLTKRDFPGDTDDVFTYSGRGLLLTAVNKNATISYTYDEEGRLIQETLNGQTISYAYDLDKKQTQITYPGGRIVTQSYDVRGRLQNLASSIGDIASFAYNVNDELSQTSYKNGAEISYTHANAKPSRITHKIGQNTPFLEYNLTHKDGQIEKEIRPDDTSRDKRYTYDVMGRLTQAVQGDSQTEADVYTLDGLGNWLDRNGEKRTVNSLNQYATVNGTAFDYDQNGNLLENHRNQYEYDYMNRITKITRKSDGKVIEYKYDAKGRRISRISGGVTTNYFYDQMVRVIEEQGNNVTTATYVVGDRPDIYTMDRNGKTYYYHQDIRGSVIKITDASGNVAEEYEYDAYGNMTLYDGAGNVITSSAIGNPYGFASSMFDPDAELYYMLNRYYDPYLGRFMTMDPQGYKDGGNLYEYTISDPVNRSDFMGLSSKQCFKQPDIKWSPEPILKVLRMLKGDFSKPDHSKGLTISKEECFKECCKNGELIVSDMYKKVKIEADITISEDIPTPWSFSIPNFVEVGVFATVSLFVKGSGEYEESLTDNCKIEYGGKFCVSGGGSVGFKGGAKIEFVAEAWIKGGGGSMAEICYGSKGLEAQMCLTVGASIEINSLAWWFPYGTEMEILSGKACATDKGEVTGGFRFLGLPE